MCLNLQITSGNLGPTTKISKAIKILFEDAFDYFFYPIMYLTENMMLLKISEAENSAEATLKLALVSNKSCKPA